MKDQDKTKAQLISELEELRGRVAALTAQVAQIQQSEADRERISNSLPVLVATAGLDGYYKKVNASFEKILGWSEQESLSRPFMEFIHPDDRPVATETFSQLRAGKPVVDFLDRNICKDGSQRWVNWTVIPLPDRGIVLGIGQDITEKKLAEEERQRAEQALRQSKQRLALHFQQTPLGAIEWDLDFKVTRWNPGAEKIFGHSLPEALGCHASFVVAPSAREDVDRIWNDLLVRKGGERSTNENVTKDGRTVLCEWYNTPLVDAEGNVIGVASLVEDITDRKRVEQILQQQARELATLNRLGQHLNTNLPLDQFGEAVVQGIRDAISPDVVMFFRRDGDELLLHSFGPPDCQVCRTPLTIHRVGECLCGLAVGEGRSVYSSDIGRDPRCTLRECKMAVLRSFAALPLRSGDEIIGVLGLGSATERDFHEESSFLETLASDIALCFHNSLLYEQVQVHAAELEQRVKDRTAELAIFQRFAEASGLGFLMADLDGYITYWNPTLCRLFGEDRPENVVGKHVTAYYPKECFERRQNEILPAVMRDGHWQGELLVYSRHGKTTPILQNTFLIRDEEGNPVRLAAAITDMTELKQAEAALQQSHDELQAIYDRAVLGIIIGDFETMGVVRANTAYCRMVGYSEEELGTISPERVHPPEVLPQVWEHLETAKQGSVARIGNLPFLRKDGSIVYADVVSSLILYGGHPCLICFFHDVTERHKAQEALAESEEKYRQLVETTGTGYLILDGQGRVIDANAEYIRLSGHHTLEEILGRTVVEWTAPYDVERNAKEVEKCCRQGFVRQLEIDYVHPDGKILPLEINATCLDGSDGRRIVSLCRDITERKQAQEALQREHQSLWHMLQASDHERQIISYEVHDGLAQYLAGAGMQLQMLDHFRETNPQEAKTAYDAAVQLVREAHSESRRLISAVRPPVLDEAGLETAISHLVHDHRVLKGPNIKFDSDVRFSRLPSILEDSLYRIAQEALTNACKHSDSKKVTVTLTQEGQDVRLEVEDWGIGFDPESVEKGHFGLEGIRQRVRLLGGRLKIESKPGAGTLVQAIVPIVESQIGR